MNVQSNLTTILILLVVNEWIFSDWDVSCRFSQINCFAYAVTARLNCWTETTFCVNERRIIAPDIFLEYFSVLQDDVVLCIYRGMFTSCTNLPCFHTFWHSSHWSYTPVLFMHILLRHYLNIAQLLWYLWGLQICFKSTYPICLYLCWSFVVSQAVCLMVCLAVCLSGLSFCLSVCLSACLPA
jgi:hypothetical protein